MNFHSKEEVVIKSDKDSEEGVSKPVDFQAKFLEFNRQQLETKKEKGKEDIAKVEQKIDDKSEVGQFAAFLQGSDAMAERWEVLMILQ